MSATAETTAAPQAKICLVCGHSCAEHESGVAVCTGVGGLCQCHAYSPDEHPAARLAARRAHDHDHDLT